MNPPIDPADTHSRKYSRLKLLAVLLTLLGIGLFGYFIYAVGFSEIVDGVVRFGVAGFAVILVLYFLRLITRAQTWKMCVHEPDELRLRDTVPAVIIGEALSSTIPLGILVSGTSKAIAVRKKISLVAGLSSVATENLFYSLITSLFLIAGAAVMLRTYAVDESLIVTVNILIVSVALLLLLGIFMVVRQWHFASVTCNWLFEKGFLTRLLENGRGEVRRFEDFIYGFYRKYPRRFLPICFFEFIYHVLGIAEVWYILSRITDGSPSLLTAFLLESVSRLVTIIFKLVPFVIGVDEAGAQFVGETVALGAGVAVTLAIIRKGRILFWTAIGVVLIIKRGFSIKEISAALDE
ncbi:MAG: lysylphosphatidylglycerol synthase domain-containing protein [Pyrinomonadaceae bacterium]